MTKTQEALRLMQRLRNNVSFGDSVQLDGTMALLLDTATEALQKREPLPPSPSIDLSGEQQRRLGIVVYHCPGCLSAIISRRPAHCDHCGQALDWI